MVPRATYRLQFSPEFTFRHTIDIIDYLNDLGVSDIYASPILKSRSGSTHGYDVIDPAQIDEQIGDRLSSRT
jgi:(1->4)-alpha-D-glucan 1-alpha-D-glucosylmutase